MDNLTIICGEVIELYDEEIKTIPTNFNENKSKLSNAKFLYFTCIFINYYHIIDTC